MARIYGLKIHDGAEASDVEDQVCVTERGQQIALLSIGESIGMGNGSLRITWNEKDGIVAVRENASGEHVYDQPIREGREYRFGPFFAHKVVGAEEESDPIKAVLRGFDIPIGRLEYFGKGDDISLRLHCYVEEMDYRDGYSSAVGLGLKKTHETVFTDGAIRERSSEDVSFGYGYYDDIVIAGAEVVITARRFQFEDDPESHFLNQVMICEKCSPDTLRKYLAEAVQSTVSSVELEATV